ncbi:MAG: AAA family ATPase [Candidatus Nitrospinota bacterium M3_3B_026]
MREPHFEEAVLDLNFYRDWVARREAALEKEKPKRTYFVTISREYGCEGYEAADKLVKKINERSTEPWTLFTHRMMEQMVADSESETVEMVREVSEKRWKFRDWFVDALVPRYLQSPSSHVFEGMRNVILNLADKGNCVILGSGGQVITHMLDPKKFMGIHIRVVASHSWRLRRVEELFKLNRVEAENLLRARQSARSRFVADFTGMDSSDPSLYHLVFNNARNNTDMMSDIILRYLELSEAFG